MKLFALLASAASADNLLYCIYAGGHTNPNALPNNMCCPFIEQPGIKGKPYHAAIHGCCGTQLYDLNTQDCCVDSSTVIEQGFNSLTVDPSTFIYIKYEGQDMETLQWDAVGTGNSYIIEVISMVDENGDDITGSGPEPVGLAQTSEAEFIVFNSVIEATVTVKVTVVNCMGEESSHGVEYTFTNE